MSSQPIVQWNYVMYFHIRGSFFKNFLHHLLKRVDNLKEIVNMQSLFVLTVVYVDMTTYPPTKHFCIIERVYFIYRLFILFVSTLSFLLFLFKRDYLHASINILFYTMFYIINTMKKHQTLLYHDPIYNTKIRSRFEPGLPSPLVAATPLCTESLCNPSHFIIPSQFVIQTCF